MQIVLGDPFERAFDRQRGHMQRTTALQSKQKALFYFHLPLAQPILSNANTGEVPFFQGLVSSLDSVQHSLNP